MSKYNRSELHQPDRVVMSKKFLGTEALSYIVLVLRANPPRWSYQLYYPGTDLWVIMSRFRNSKLHHTGTISLSYIVQVKEL